MPTVINSMLDRQQRNRMPCNIRMVIESRRWRLRLNGFVPAKHVKDQPGLQSRACTGQTVDWTVLIASSKRQTHVYLIYDPGEARVTQHHGVSEDILAKCATSTTSIARRVRAGLCNAPWKSDAGLHRSRPRWTHVTLRVVQDHLNNSLTECIAATSIRLTIMTHGINPPVTVIQRRHWRDWSIVVRLHGICAAPCDIRKLMRCNIETRWGGPGVANSRRLHKLVKSECRG
jgi:hypothetical protein